MKPRIQAKKLFTAGALMLLAGLLARIAWGNINQAYSVALIILAALLFLGGVFLFAANLRE